jgi:hypothetical protein
MTIAAYLPVHRMTESNGSSCSGPKSEADSPEQGGDADEIRMVEIQESL